MSENHDVLKKFGVEVCRFVVKKEESEGNVVLCEKDWKLALISIFVLVLFLKDRNKLLKDRNLIL